MSEGDSQQDSTPKSGTECFYMVDGKKEDAGIHDEMLAGGTAGVEASRDFARHLGLTEEQIELLYGEQQPGAVSG